MGGHFVNPFTKAGQIKARLRGRACIGMVSTRPQGVKPPGGLEPYAVDLEKLIRR